MGNGIAQVGATSGKNVSCMDVNPAALKKAQSTVGKSTTKLIENGKITSEQKSKSENINFVSNMSTADRADFVIEASSENLKLKLKIFNELDEKAFAGIILASNTSSINITKITAAS